MKLFFFLLSIVFFFFAFAAQRNGDASANFLFPFGFLSLMLSLLIKRKKRDDFPSAEPTEQITQSPEIPPERSKVEAKMLELGTAKPIQMPIQNTPSVLSCERFLNDFDDAYIAFDLETTGLSPADDAIIEIGAVKVLDGVVVDEYSQLINPGIPIPPAATAVNHITDAMVANQPEIRKALIDFLVFAGDWPCVAHNARFDVSFLQEAADRHGLSIPNAFADSLQMAKQYFAQLHDKKLATVCAAIGYQIGEAHRALDDAKAVHAIIQACAQQREQVKQSESAYVMHIRLSSKIESDYKFLKEMEEPSAQQIDAILDLCRKDFDLVQPARLHAEIQGWGAPRVDSFRRAIQLLVKRRDYDEAIAICRRAVELEIPDNMEGGMAGRLEKLIRQKEAAQARQNAEQEREARRAEKQRIREEKQAADAEKAPGPSNKRKVLQYSYDGTELIQAFESVAGAAKVTQVAPKSIRDAANGIQKHAGGFTWRYAEGEVSQNDLNL